MSEQHLPSPLRVGVEAPGESHHQLAELRACAVVDSDPAASAHQP